MYTWDLLQWLTNPVICNAFLVANNFMNIISYENIPILMVHSALGCHINGKSSLPEGLIWDTLLWLLSALMVLHFGVIGAKSVE